MRGVLTGNTQLLGRRMGYEEAAQLLFHFGTQNLSVSNDINKKKAKV